MKCILYNITLLVFNATGVTCSLKKKLSITQPSKNYAWSSGSHTSPKSNFFFFVTFREGEKLPARNQAADSTVYCFSIHRGVIVFHSNSSLVIGSSSAPIRNSEFEGDSEEFVNVIVMNDHHSLISFVLAIMLRYVAIL